MEKLPEQNLESSVEKQRQQRRLCFKERLKSGVLLASALFVAGSKIKDKVDEYRWEDHIASTTTVDERESIKRYEDQIRDVFGQEAVDRIKDGDRRAFLSSTDERNLPELKGFDKPALKKIANEITEGSENYPKKWLKGQVGSIEFRNENVKSSWFGDMIEAGNAHKSPFFGKPYILLYRGDTPEEKDYMDKTYPDGSTLLSNNTVAHEIGHLNDWEMNLDLTLKEREELLMAVHQRMGSNDAYHRDDAPYHERYSNGTKFGLYKEASEYWADICAQYFFSPVSFRQKFPKDFDLVDKVVMKKDSTYDTFSKVKFDPYTGKPRKFSK